MRVSELVFSVVIPVFNEEGNLEPLYTRLTKVMNDGVSPMKSYLLLMAAVTPRLKSQSAL